MFSQSSGTQLTPLMQQYVSLKKDHPDSILFFRLGDFYEMFFEDAVVAAPLLEVQLTSRDKSSENPIPMCGIPHHAATNYLQKLIQKGHKVAICEQTETPILGKPGKSIIKREVARVVTPALVGDPDLVSESSQQYLLVIHRADSTSFELGIIDLLGGELRIGHVSSKENLFDWILRLSPKEFLVNESEKTSLWAFELSKRFPSTLLTFRKFFEKGVLSAARSYLEETVRSTKAFSLLQSFSLEENACMSLDSVALHSLELLKSHSSSGESHSLFSVLDQSLTPMGHRTLRNWLSHPLLDPGLIEQRLESVNELIQEPQIFQGLKAELSHIRDLERLSSKTALGLSMPRDLVAIRDVLKRIPVLKTLLDGTKSILLKQLASDLDSLPKLVDHLERALNDEAPATLRDGNIFKESYHPEIAELRSLTQDAKTTIAALEARERESSGIPSLKIKFSKVFGYTFEVTSTHLKKVPAHFVRKQTIANGERFVSEELKNFEDKMVSAEAKLKALEEDLFLKIRAEVGEQSIVLIKNAKLIGILDCLLSFSKVSRERGYCRPKIHSGWNLKIKAGRHPVIEMTVGAGKFIPNDIEFNENNCRTLLITGPNMAGKSTMMRQVALTLIMAQVGCFVPAAHAELPLVDAIFTRVGSSDDLARGQSTFMVEMSEVARILEKASSKSLLVIDEVGRGTSTYDGLSLAWSLLEHIHLKLKAKTLFATHFHELTTLEKAHPSLRNANVLVKKEGDEITFLHQLVFGSCNRSYGIEVAKLAGLPDPILIRATQLLNQLESEAKC